MGEPNPLLPLVSLIVPCRNEAAFIRQCLDSVVGNDYPRDRTEVFVVDGMSTDGTRDVLRAFMAQYANMTLLDNDKGTIPCAMNIGIDRAKGSVVMKIDAHAVYPSDYISKCVAGLDQYKADNVGGVIVTLPRSNTLMARSIVLSISNIFGIGNSAFRLGCAAPVSARTTYSGCYRRDVFDRVGRYDENIARSEDVVLNAKILKAGGRIMVDPGIVVRYYARSSFGAFVRHNFNNGFWTTYPLRFGTVFLSLRHLIPLVFVASLLVLAGLALLKPSADIAWISAQVLMLILVVYGTSCAYFSGRIAAEQKDARFLGTMPLVFLTLHVTYGAGSLFGLLTILGQLPMILRNKK